MNGRGPWGCQVSENSALCHTLHVQDAAEYLQHLLELISRTERKHGGRLGGSTQTADLFTFEMEIRCSPFATRALILISYPYHVPVC